jgi:hypothetical protein
MIASMVGFETDYLQLPLNLSVRTFDDEMLRRSLSDSESNERMGLS